MNCTGTVLWDGLGHPDSALTLPLPHLLSGLLSLWENPHLSLKVTVF